MEGISSKAGGVLPNKDKTFQGQKFDDDLGLNWVEFKWRNHDPQIGRFIEIDPLAEDYEYNSTYAFSENKVTSHIELEGLEAIPIEQVVEEAEAAVPIIEKYGDNIAHGIGITVTAIGAWVSSNLDKVATGMETLAKSGALNSSQSYPATLDLYIKSGMSGAPQVPTTVQAKATSSSSSQTQTQTSTKKETGSYTNTHESGKTYHGKGDEQRAAQSGKEKAKEHNDPLKSTEHTKAKNYREAFKQESKRMEKDVDKNGNKGHKSENNYNKKDSPGTKYRKQDGD